ncbi:hypothetical protein [Polaromonas sp.]
MFQLLHRILAYASLALLVRHMAGALKHRFADRDAQVNVLRCML